MNKIQNSNVRNLVKAYYREENIGKPLIGTGFAVDAYRWTALTGKLVGDSNHRIKMLEGVLRIRNIMNKSQLNSFDKRILTEILKDITNALKAN